MRKSCKWNYFWYHFQKVQLYILLFQWKCSKSIRKRNKLIAWESQRFHLLTVFLNIRYHKTVLLHERKRYTARRIASTHPTVLSQGGGGYLVPGQGGSLRKGPGTSHWVPLERTWDQWKYYGMEMGYPPGGQTDTCENSTFPSYYVRGRLKARSVVKYTHCSISWKVGSLKQNSLQSTPPNHRHSRILSVRLRNKYYQLLWVIRPKGIIKMWFFSQKKKKKKSNG